MQFKYLKHDLYRYFYPNNDVSELSFLRKVDTIIFTQAIWATIVYRFRRWLIYECRFPIIRLLLKPVGSILHLFVEMTTGIHIRPEIDIGPGLYIGHFGGIFLGGNTKIGKFCNVSQENTIGYGGRGSNRGLPTIGDFVHIGPGRKSLGKLLLEIMLLLGRMPLLQRTSPMMPWQEGSLLK